MYVLMYLEITFPIEWFTAQITAKWLLPTVYALMLITE
jgi:hypothetical protein